MKILFDVPNLGDSPEILRKLCLSKKFPPQSFYVKLRYFTQFLTFITMIFRVENGKKTV